MDELMRGVDTAASHGATVISMSWGGPETSQETSTDSHFLHPGVSYVAASGDRGTGSLYPASSPYVIAVGGTTLTLTGNGSIASETAWSGSGGGASKFETALNAQHGLSGSGFKITPDVAYDADPSTGYPVASTSRGKTAWSEVGGTSAGAPQWAGIAALSAERSGKALTSSRLYAARSSFNDITRGSNGRGALLCSAKAGFDAVTGLGTPKAGNLVRELASIP